MCSLWVFFISQKKRCEYIQANALVTNISTILSAISFQLRQMIFDMWTSWVDRPKFKEKTYGRCLCQLDANSAGYSRLYFLGNRAYSTDEFHTSKLKIKNQHYALATLACCCCSIWQFQKSEIFLNERISGIYLRRSVSILVSCPLIGAVRLCMNFFFSYC